MKKQFKTLQEQTVKATTLSELLVVMIVSGILFLLLFDGLQIIQRYGRILDRKLMEKSSLLYSHQTLEMLMERTDSIRKEDRELLFYTRTHQQIERMKLDSTCLVLHGITKSDTLFSGLASIELRTSEDSSSAIDSLFLWMRIGKDSIRLEYGK